MVNKNISEIHKLATAVAPTRFSLKYQISLHMKKEYKRLAVHCKDATIHEKADTSIELVSIYFDKEDVICITQQSISPFISDKHELYVNNYVNENNLSLYDVMFAQFNIRNVLLSDKDLEYLCSD